MNYIVMISAIVVCQSAHATKPKLGAEIPSGIYSNVRESEETGDRGGIEFRLFAQANPAYVQAVVCESECNGTGKYYINPNKDGFSFTWTNPRFPEQVPIEFQVWKAKNTVWIVGKDGAWVKEKVTRVKKPLGLYGYK